MGQIVNSDAVIIGPYAQALTIDNKLRSFVYMFGLPHKEPDLLRKYSCTHLAVDPTNEDFAARDYPELAQRVQLARYWFRDVMAYIYLLPAQAQSHDYKLNDFERAADILQIRKI